mmetsp:Transcript_104561/g.180599  ORF Transcript_104561/g.180599 Transcript_104561/m.180599 type:complete len:318 (+) Transcript_104561:92-1045(+)
MRVTLFVLAALAVTGYGRRVQTSFKPTQGFVGAPSHGVASAPRGRVGMEERDLTRGGSEFGAEADKLLYPHNLTKPSGWGYTTIGYNYPYQEGRDGYMYNPPYAPYYLGGEYINRPNARKPLKDFVGAQEEFQLGTYFKGDPLEPWDPLNLHLLSKVSANNPDVSFFREAELKHGRIAMLAFVGICTTASGKHWAPEPFAEACKAGWPSSLGQILSTNPGIFWQGLFTIALVEGVTNTNRGEGKEVNWWDGLWFGERKDGIVAGDLGFDPLGLLSKDPEAANVMKLKELKNGRLAMLAVMDIFIRYLNTGKAFPEMA